MSRLGWTAYFLGIAEAVAERADCSRRKVGAVIVGPDHRVISTGYNGAASKAGSCLAGDCPRGRHYQDATHLYCGCGEPWPCAEAVTPGSSYDTGPGACFALHAEQNAIIYARESLVGCSIYVTSEPCDGCIRLIKGVGITNTHYLTNT